MFLFHKMMSFAAHCWCISDKCYKCWSITKCCGSCSYQYLKVVLVLLSVSQCCGQCHIVVTQALINITMLCLFSCQYHNAVLVLISIALAQCCARGSLRHHYVITSSTTWPFSTPLAPSSSIVITLQTFTPPNMTSLELLLSMPRFKHFKQYNRLTYTQYSCYMKEMCKQLSKKSKISSLSVTCLPIWCIRPLLHGYCHSQQH